MGGVEIREEIVPRDDEARRYDYRIVSAPFDYTSHQAWMQVEPDGDGSRAVWGTNLESDVARGGLEPMFEQVLQRLKETIEGR